MELREPNWRNKDSDWGLFPLTKKELIKGYLSFPGEIYKFYRQENKKKKIVHHIKKLDKVKIALGSGKHVPEGWVGIDYFHKAENVFPANLLLGIPLESNSVDEILAEHIIEHFYLDDIFFVLSECYRVLRPGGKIRIVCPDAKNLAELILQGKEAEKDHDVINDAEIHHWPKDNFRWARFINRLSHQWGQHKSLLSGEMLSQILTQVGFENIYEASDRESKIFDTIPDIHFLRFPNDSIKLNFALEAIATKNQ